MLAGSRFPLEWPSAPRESSRSDDYSRVNETRLQPSEINTRLSANAASVAIDQRRGRVGRRPRPNQRRLTGRIHRHKRAERAFDPRRRAHGCFGPGATDEVAATS